MNPASFQIDQRIGKPEIPRLYVRWHRFRERDSALDHLETPDSDYIMLDDKSTSTPSLIAGGFMPEYVKAALIGESLSRRFPSSATYQKIPFRVRNPADIAITPPGNKQRHAVKSILKRYFGSGNLA
jgi:hypothetical protein